MNILLSLLMINSIFAMEVKVRPLAPRANECQLCHIKRQTREVFLSPKKVTTKEHTHIDIAHGSLKKACNDCHDLNNSNKLILPATFANTNQICARCHIENYAEWQRGQHGKKTGGWLKNNVAYNCIDCHDPHNVSFKKMMAVPGPVTHK